MELLKVYGEIKGKMKDDDLSDWKTICPLINELPKEHTLLIGLLIIHHFGLDKTSKYNSRDQSSSIKDFYTQERKGRKKLTPYGSKVFEGNGILFTASDLPDDLKRMISCYLRLIS